MLFSIFLLLEYDPCLSKYFSKYKFKYLQPQCRFYLIQIIAATNGLSPEQKTIFINSEFSEPELEGALKNCYQEMFKFNLLRKKFLEAATKKHSSIPNFIKSKIIQSNSEFVKIETSEIIIREIETAVNCNLPILLHGKPGSGKTTIVEEANSRFGNQGLSF